MGGPSQVKPARTGGSRRKFFKRASATTVGVVGARTRPARDHTVKVDALGLMPCETYYCQFSAEGSVSPIGRTKTLPVGSSSQMRMAVVSGPNHASGYFNAYARIAQRADLDLVRHLGDYLHEYGAGQYGSARTPEPLTEIVLLTDRLPSTPRSIQARC